MSRAVLRQPQDRSLFGIAWTDPGETHRSSLVRDRRRGMSRIVFRPGGEGDDPRSLDAAAEAVSPCPELAAILTQQRDALSERLYEVVADAPKTLAMLEQGGREFVLQAEKRPLVDYLVLRFRTGDALYEQLYVGEKLKQFHLEPLPDEERRPFRERVAALEQQAIRDVVASAVSPAARTALDEVLARLYGTIVTERRRTAHVLLVGDCLHLDVVTFAQPALAAEGITLEPTYAT